MSTPSPDVLWITRAARERLQAELDDLTRAGSTPSEGSDARIRDLRNLLRRAEVGDKPDDGLVEPGMTITVELDGDATSRSFLLAERGITGVDMTVDVYSPTSPVGAAILGKHPGDVFSYTAPNGTAIRGHIVAAAPFRD